MSDILIIGFLSWMLDVDFGFFGCLSLSFEFGLPHPHPKLNFFWVPVSDYTVNIFAILKITAVVIWGNIS